MPLRFDATVKDLARRSPPSFLAAFDRPTTEPVALLNVDLSTVTSSTDLVFGVGDPLREVIHFDAQSGPSPTKHREVLVYSALLHRQFRVPVHSVVLLLRREAEHPNLTGMVRYEARPGRCKMEFSYDLVRIWELPAETLLTGALPLTPFASLGELPAGLAEEDALRPVVRRLLERVLAEATEGQARELLTAAYTLIGLRVPPTVARNLFSGVTAMHDSSTYQAILDEGGIRTLRKAILQLGQTLWGPPDPPVKAVLEGVEELSRLETLHARMVKVASWQELLATS